MLIWRPEHSVGSSECLSRHTSSNIRVGKSISEHLIPIQASAMEDHQVLQMMSSQTSCEASTQFEVVRFSDSQTCETAVSSSTNYQTYSGDGSTTSG